MTPIAVLSCQSTRRWRVDILDELCSPEWTNLQLVRLGADGLPFVVPEGRHFKEKRSLYLGWNGERFATNKFLAWAQTNDPDLIPQLQKIMEAPGRHPVSAGR